MKKTYHYTVQPENQCGGLKIWAKEQGHNNFKGFIRYSTLNKEYYLTLDDITYTPLRNAENLKEITKLGEMNVIFVEPQGEVICDYCGEDYTTSDVQGGILFCSCAVCPKCVEDNAQKYNETKHIKGRCPEDMSFKEWVYKLREI